MPIKNAAKKYMRKSARQRALNLIWKNKIKITNKKTRKLARQGKIEEAKKAYQVLIKTVDKASKKGIIHKNKAARLKSRIAALISKSTKKSA